MSAYLIGQIVVKNIKLWQDYVDGVAESLVPFKAKIMFRGKRHSVLAGQNKYDLVVVIKFADHTTLNNWFYSAKYQSLIPVRERAANVVITTYVE